MRSRGPHRAVDQRLGNVRCRGQRGIDEGTDLLEVRWRKILALQNS
jgi:hypothetical protein